MVSVLKQERFTAFHEATTLASAQQPKCFTSEDNRHLTLAEEGNESTRVVLADEAWIQTEQIAKRRVRKSMKTHWRWTA